MADIPEIRQSAEAPAAGPGQGTVGLYPRYVLAVLVVVYFLNFIDRQILAVLAEHIKADLGITDAQLGFLFGAAFATFYAVMGLPLARLADTWNRKKLISIGLGFWSLMTALSGLARGFLPLAACRFGVGVGEASASPAAYSMLYDYFPARVRTTVIAIYSSGVFIGQGIGIFLGGLLLQTWLAWYPDPATAPFGLKGWQVAFFVVGLPGILMAFWVATLREPVRGAFDGVVTAPHPRPFAEAGSMLASMLPPTSFIWLVRNGRMRALAFNVLIAALIVVGAWALIRATGDLEQWLALGVGAYAVVCWKQSLSHRDPATSHLIFRNRTLMYTVFGVAATNFMLSSFGYWSIPYFLRRFELEPGQVGLMMGAGTAVMGLLGVAGGGFLADRLRRRFVAGKLIVILASLVGALATAALMLRAQDVGTAFVFFLVMLVFSSAGLGPAVSTINDLVLPRMRATASAFGFMVTYLVAGSIGPYAIGKLSDIFTASLGDPGLGLRQAMAVSLVVPIVGLVLAVSAIRSIARDEPAVIEEARRKGESV